MVFCTSALSERKRKLNVEKKENAVSLTAFFFARIVGQLIVDAGCGSCEMNLSLLNVLSIVVLFGLIVMGVLHYRLDRKGGKKNRH